MTCSTVRTAYHVSQDCTMIRLKSACPCGMLLTPPTSRAMSCQGCRDSLFAPLLISAYNNDHRHSFVKETGIPKERKLIGLQLETSSFSTRSVHGAQIYSGCRRPISLVFHVFPVLVPHILLIPPSLSVTIWAPIGCPSPLPAGPVRLHKMRTPPFIATADFRFRLVSLISPMTAVFRRRIRTIASPSTFAPVAIGRVGRIDS